MYTDQEDENYMSEPIDEISQSSYIKINKKFLEQLKNTHEIDDLLKYRQQSDSQNQIKNQHQFKRQKISEKPTCIPKNIQNIHSRNQIKKSTDGNIDFLNNQSSENTNSNSSSQEIQQFFKDKNKNYQKNYEQQLQHKQFYSTYSNDLNTSNININNHTQNHSILGYYLLQKQVQKKSRTHSKLAHMKQQSKNRQSLANINKILLQRTNSKVQFGRINYKKMLENQIKKNSVLEKQIYQLETKLANIHSIYEESVKQNKKIYKKTTEADKVRYENKIKMKNLDKKIQNIKRNYKNSYISKETKYNIEQIRKQNINLKEQNQKYRIFMSSLSESIFTLKGRRPKKLDQIWDEWKIIFQGYSQKKWVRCPNQSLTNSSTNKKL